ncbi:MAG: nitroreductase family protein [Patescibacteria group bacterium]
MIKKGSIMFYGLISLNRVFSILYHMVFFLPFSREQHASIKATYAYYRNIDKLQATRVDLRRNVHRIEKGLSMKKVRKTFAFSYIEETIESYMFAVQQYLNNPEFIDVNELYWAHDVLEMYFQAVELGKSKQYLKDTFLELNGKLQNMEKEKESSTMRPFLASERHQSQVSYDDFLALAKQRRSVRWFQGKPVPRELIDKAILAARESPSACNRLPYEYKVFDDAELVKQVSHIPFGAKGYADNIPVVVVLVGKLSHFFSPRDRHIIYIDASLSAMSFMFALETLGLSSSVINWPDFEPLEITMQHKLKLQVDERPIMLIAVGYADPKGKIPYSQKKDLKILRTYNN